MRKTNLLKKSSRVAVIDLTHGGLVIARKLNKMSCSVSGIDVYGTINSDLQTILKKEGINISAEYTNPLDFDVVISPVHFDSSNQLITKAISHKIPVLSHHQAVGQILFGYDLKSKTVIELTGTKAKTSTAILLADILSKEKKVISHTSRGLEDHDTTFRPDKVQKLSLRAISYCSHIHLICIRNFPTCKILIYFSIVYSILICTLTIAPIIDIENKKEIKYMNQRPLENLEERKILEKNKIIDFDKDMWLTHKDNLLHFFDPEKDILFSPSHSDLMNYDVIFGGLVGNDTAYQLIKNKIFYIFGQQVKNDQTNRLDDIIEELKNGVYGKIEESNFLFIDTYPYIVSNTFFLRDIVAIEKMNLSSIVYDDNYGGRCVSLLSIKRVLIDKVPIQESILEFEQKRLNTKNLRIIMTKNGIPRNDYLSKTKTEGNAGW